jgi:hypothetical protein
MSRFLDKVDTSAVVLDLNIIDNVESNVSQLVGDISSVSLNEPNLNVDSLVDGIINSGIDYSQLKDISVGKAQHLSSGLSFDDPM